MNLLHADNLCKRFGGIQAVYQASITVAEGSITGLIGPNGAGKTTFFNLLCNFIPPDRGRVYFKGRPIEKLPPHKIAQMGMVRTFQVPKVLSRLTVLENMLLGAPHQTGERFWAAFCQSPQILWEEKQSTEKARHILASVGLEAMTDRYAGSLSGGQRKLLELARTLMTDPQLVLLDEPAAGVNPALMEKICTYIQTWNQQGITFLIIEHNMDVIMSLCSHIWVLAEGQNLADGTPQEIMANDRVLEAYLGKDTPANI